MRQRPANLRLEAFVLFGRIMPFVDVMAANGGYGGVHFAPLPTKVADTKYWNANRLT